MVLQTLKCEVLKSKNAEYDWPQIGVCEKIFQNKNSK